MLEGKKRGEKKRNEEHKIVTMSCSDDDVVIIDSSSASDVSPPQEPASFHPRYRAEQMNAGDNADDDDGGGDVYARPALNAAAAAAAHNTQRRTAFDATRQRLHDQLESLPPFVAEAETQTDGGATEEEMEVMRRHLVELDAALGVRIVVPGAAAAATRVMQNHAAIRAFIASWRSTSRPWKRARHDAAAAPAGLQTTNENNVEEEQDKSDAEPLRGVKLEGHELHMSVTAATPPESSLSSPSSTPVWAEGLGAALARCQRLLQSTTTAETHRHDGISPEEGRLRAGLAAPSVQSPPSSSVTSPHQAATPSPIVKHDATPLPDTTNSSRDDVATSSLLQEAEVICAREHKDSLLPLYTELHALRRQHAQRQQEEAQTTARELQWEQRLLTDVLMECNAQLDYMNTNFMKCCRGNLAPLDALQQRMQTLQSFQRQLNTAAAVATPHACSHSSEKAKYNTAVHTCDSAAADAVVERAPRRLGKAAEVVTRHLEDERRRLQADLDATRAQLQQYEARNAELEACYAHVTAQLQHTLDAEHYVDKDAISALKTQQREALAALARQFGWTLVNSTPDVLSLRHPRTGEVLHANHTHASINGRPCNDVATALAEYVVRHAVVSPSAGAKVDLAGPLLSKSGELTPAEKTQAAMATAPTEDVAPSHDATAPPPSLPSISSSVGPRDPLLHLDDMLPPVPTSDDDETETQHEEEESIRNDEKKGGAAPPTTTSQHNGDAEATENTLAEPTGAETTSVASSPNGIRDDDGTAEAEEEEEAGGARAAEQEGQDEFSEEEEGEGASVEGDSTVNAGDEGDEAASLEEGEKKEEEEEEFVNYSNLQSDETVNPGHDSGSSFANTSAVSATTRTTTAPAPVRATTKDGRTEPDVYTGFFTENALWEDDD